MNAPLQAPIPPLREGDRLSREEFERRYDAMPWLKKAELLEGVVHMPSPVRFQQHASPHACLVWWLTTYHAATAGTMVGDNGTVRLDRANEPQPDAQLFIAPKYGGQVRLGPDDYVEGAPDLVAEVSASSAGIDLGVKLPIYLRNKVREYIVWRVADKEIDWFALHQDQYEKLPLIDHRIFKSEIFPGLRLDAAAMVRFDLAEVLRVLQSEPASPEHQQFVARLKAAHQSQ